MGISIQILSDEQLSKVEPADRLVICSDGTVFRRVCWDVGQIEMPDDLYVRRGVQELKGKFLGHVGTKALTEGTFVNQQKYYPYRSMLVAPASIPDEELALSSDSAYIAQAANFFATCKFKSFKPNENGIYTGVKVGFYKLVRLPLECAVFPILVGTLDSEEPFVYPGHYVIVQACDVQGREIWGDRYAMKEDTANQKFVLAGNVSE